MVDKLASVGIEAAVSTRDLAQVLSRCADTAYTAGISMDRLIGYSAAVGESTQKSMSDISGAFQSIYSRMSGI